MTRYFDPDVPYLFAYGSLVNDKTRPANSIGIPARLNGFVRSWRHPIQLGERYVCGVTVRRNSKSTLDGLLLLSDRQYQGQLLSDREPGYVIVTVTREAIFAPFLDTIDRPVTILSSENESWSSDVVNDCVILRSYLDVILYGYFLRFGELGVIRFLASFDDWKFPLVNDRQAPLYPRSQQINADLLRFFDDSILLTVGSIGDRCVE